MSTPETPNLHGVFRFVARLHTLSKRGMRAALANEPKCRYGMLQHLYNLIEQHGYDGAIYVSDIARYMHQPMPAVSRGLRAMEQDVGLSIERLSVDGGASRNEFIMQFQSDLLNIPVLQCESVETTAIGAAYLAGLAVGYWEDLEELEQNAQIVKTFHPHMSVERRERNLDGWHDAVKRSLSTEQ